MAIVKGGFEAQHILHARILHVHGGTPAVSVKLSTQGESLEGSLAGASLPICSSCAAINAAV